MRVEPAIVSHCKCSCGRALCISSNVHFKLLPAATYLRPCGFTNSTENAFNLKNHARRTSRMNGRPMSMNFVSFSVAAFAFCFTAVCFDAPHSAQLIFRTIHCGCAAVDAAHRAYTPPACQRIVFLMRKLKRVHTQTQPPTDATRDNTMLQ